MGYEQEKIFEEYYVKYFNKLKIYAYYSIGDWNRSEEAVQDTFHIAWVKIDSFTASKNPMGWLINTLRYTIKNIKRRDNYQTNLFISLNEYGDIPQPDETSTGVEIEDMCQSLLTREEYYLLRRVVLDKATYKEIADELGINLWACQKRMQRILKKLKNHLGDIL